MHWHALKICQFFTHSTISLMMVTFCKRMFNGCLFSELGLWSPSWPFDCSLWWFLHVVYWGLKHIFFFKTSEKTEYYLSCLKHLSIIDVTSRINLPLLCALFSSLLPGGASVLSEDLVLLSAIRCLWRECVSVLVNLSLEILGGHSIVSGYNIIWFDWLVKLIGF